MRLISSVREIVNRPHIVQLITIGIFALLLRTVYFLMVKDQVWFTQPVVDAANFHQWALEIIHGNFLGKSVFTQSPFYAYWLAGIYFIFGPSPIIASCVQFLIGIFNCWLVYFLATQYFNSKVGFIAGLLTSVYGISFLNEGTLLTVTLINFLNLILLLCIGWASSESKQWYRWFLAGIILGFSFLTRPNIILMAGVIFLWFFHLYNLKTEKTIFIKSIAGLMLGICLSIAPVTLRNYVILKEPLISVATGGLNFYLGNSNQSTGFHVPFGDLGLSAKTIVTDFQKVAEAQEGHSLSYSESNRFWFGKTIADIFRNPLHWQQLLINKLLLFFNNYEITTSLNYSLIRQSVSFYKIPWLSFGIVCPLALLGIIFLYKEWKRLFILFSYSLIYLVTNIFIMVSSEYRYAIVPIFIVFSAFTLARFFDWLKQKMWSKVLKFSCLLTALFILCNTQIISKAEDDYRLATAHYNFGSLFMRLEDFKNAALEFSLGRKYLPENQKMSLALSDALYKCGEYKAAFESIEEAYRIDPTDINVMTTYANLLTARGDYDHALRIRQAIIDKNPSNAFMFFNLGITYLWAGREAEAEAAFKQATQRDPAIAEQCEKSKKSIQYNRLHSSGSLQSNFENSTEGLDNRSSLNAQPSQTQNVSNDYMQNMNNQQYQQQYQQYQQLQLQNNQYQSH